MVVLALVDLEMTVAISNMYVCFRERERKEKVLYLPQYMQGGQKFTFTSRNK